MSMDDSFFLQLDNEDWTYPIIRYDTVFKYADADESDRRFCKFHLPDRLLEDPANEEVTAKRATKSSNPRILHIRNSDE